MISVHDHRSVIMLLPVLLLFIAAATTNTSPRLKHTLPDHNTKRVPFQQVEQFATTLLEGQTVYIGGNGILYQINFDDSSTPNEIRLPDVPEKCRGQNTASCGNYIMVLQRFDENKLLVCATGSPYSRCWLSHNGELKEFINGQKRVLGRFVLPSPPRQGFASLVVEERIYSAAPFDGDKMVFDGYRKNDDIKRLRADTRWMNDPRFVGMSPVKDLIYMFFRERISQNNPDVDPWISRIARVCKDDHGGSPRRLQMKWSTFLKARLLCNEPNNVHFNRIEDTFIYKSAVDNETRVYGVFSSNWNGTAVCVYSMKEIGDVFKTSDFKDSNGPVPSNPRPGTCVKNTKELPDEVLALVEDHPEMKTLISPIGGRPLMTSYDPHIKKIVVDSVVGPNGEENRLLILAMGDGTIHKVLETGTSTFTIAQLTVLKQPAPILSLSLDSDRKLLYVTSTMELARFPLVACEEYVGPCATCLQARDPYCGWDNDQKKCIPVTPNSKNVVQNLTSGDGCVTIKAEMARSSAPRDGTVLRLPLNEGIPVYLSCPKQSYHADYTWTFSGEGGREGAALFVQ
ncbi:semaphorin-7A-like [Leucoraja erinacea]|uniref:semaphorin-7A-like n=1 Tax=Leucoraja erinaceus TaxID=7782 RepID=UPI0024554A34|nr:semaphorin-7A-like [Leucoraja erinacea]